MASRDTNANYLLRPPKFREILSVILIHVVLLMKAYSKPTKNPENSKTLLAPFTGMDYV